MAPTDSPISLLVVDDEEAIRNAVRKYLVRQGFEVSVAATGEEALAILERQKVTGILLDVNLPGTNGIDLVPQILELAHTGDGLGAVGLVVDLERNGRDAHFAAPFAIRARRMPSG